MDKKFWKNRSVLITGFEGFLGSNLTKKLIGSGARVFGLDIRVGRKDTILTSADYKRMTVIKGSVVDYRLLKNIINKNKINIIFHLAAESIVGRCHNNPLCGFSTNIEGTWKLLDVCRGAGHVEGIVVASSDKAYGSHKNLPYVENTPLAGRNPYDVSKSCADLIARSYFYAYGLPVSVARCGNIYGPGDFNFSRIVPDAVRSALTGKTLLIRSDGKFTRDYVYVDDIVDGYMMLAEKLRKFKLQGEAFNFSNKNPVTVIKLINNIFKSFGKQPDYRILNKVKHEIRHQYLSSAKAKSILRWKPSRSLKDGLNKTIGWYKGNFMGGKYL